MGQEEKNLSRRDFLKTTGIATGTLVSGGIIGGLIGYNSNKKSKPSNNANKNTGHDEHAGIPARMFFMSQTDFQVLSNATERIFPKDDLGAGAIDLGVPYFIDRQLAGNYGSNSREYMKGPFAEGAPTQGYQSHLTRAEIFTQGIMALEKESKKRFKKGFSDISEKQMDEVLTAFQKDEVKIPGASSAMFFTLLRSATLEGAYSDPMYGGNRNLEGWKMKGFPGHQMAYISVIEDEKFQKIEPKPLGNM